MVMLINVKGVCFLSPVLVFVAKFTSFGCATKRGIFFFFIITLVFLDYTGSD